MKIQLVNPCMNSGYEVNSRNGVMHPLGLLAVAAYVGDRFPHPEIEVLDGSVMGRDQINARLRADIIGCTTGVLSYEHALEVAQIGKSRGARIVFGGPLASALPRQILLNRPDVDCVVMGDGEEAFAQLVVGAEPTKIPNLGWRCGGSVVLNPRVELDLDRLPFPNRSLLDVEAYFRNYRQINVAQAFSRPMTFYSGKGCLYAATHGRCVFCARMDGGYRSRSPELVWKELQGLASDFAADAFWDVADGVLSDQPWMQRFEETRPESFDPKLVIYGRADAVTARACERLQRLNCHLVFLGFESGSDEVLSRTAFGKTVAAGKEAARILADHGIKMMASLILGLPGETVDTVRRTVEFAHWLGSLGNLETVSASVLMPLPGSSVYSMLCEEHPDKYPNADYFDLEDARRDWLGAHTEVSLDYLYSVLPELLGVGQVASSLGRPHVP